MLKSSSARTFSLSPFPAFALAQLFWLCAAAPAAADTYLGSSGPDILIGTPKNDLFRGFGGSDYIYGDFFTVGNGFPDIEIPCRAGAGVEDSPTAGLSNQSTSLLNDLLDDGLGDDRIVGDASALKFGEFQLYALSGTGALRGGRGGDFNSARCFSDSGARDLGEDSFVGGPGRDLFVGDAYYRNQHGEDLNMDAGAGSAGMGRYSFHPYVSGGDGGNNNSLDAFGDLADFRFSTTGSKTLIGDAYGQGPPGSEDHLIASAGSGARNGPGDGGDINTVSAFNDRLLGAPAGNLIVGDDYRLGGSGGVLLVASAGSGGETGGGSGGDGNTVSAFSDDLEGDVVRDVIVGDVLLLGGPGDDLTFTAFAGRSPLGGGGGGSGNTISAFSDQLRGGDGDDVLIGDGWNQGDSEGVHIVIDGGAGNAIQSFGDLIEGGRGNDRIVGDIRYANTSVCEIDELDISGGAAVSAFADLISGDDGNDLIHGGFGADQMAGGSGRDTFTYYGPDIEDLGAGVPADSIPDFQVPGPLRDRLDLRPLLTCLGFDHGDPVTDWLRVTGTNLEIDRDGPGGAFTFVPLVSAPAFAGLTQSFLISNLNLFVP